MNATLATLVLALTATAPAWAGNDPISELAQRSGLSERKVSMLLGNRTAYAEYRYTYDRSLKRFVAAIGRHNYDRLMQGDAIVLLEPQADSRVVQQATARATERQAL